MVKHAGLIVLTVGLGCIFVYAVQQALFRTCGSRSDGAVLPGYDPVPSDIPAVFFGNPYGPGNTPVWPVPSNIWTNRVAAKPGPVFDLPGPRIYKAVPYSMLVLVPGRGLDVRVIKPARSIDRMPIMRPELKLIPWK